MATSLERLFPGHAPVLLDGGLGTSLHALGWPATEATVLANLHAPGLVAAVHTAFREAGAAVLATNSFGALPGAAGVEERRLEAVAASVRIARKVADTRTPGAPPRAFVAGALAAADLVFHGPRLRDVVAVLLDGGVDLLLFETCNTVADADRALQIALELAPHLPVVVCASSTSGDAADRQRVQAVLALVSGSGLAEAGLNCCRGPHDLFKLAVAQQPLPRWLAPNRGLPEDLVDDNVMAAFARAACQRGARFIGGCCGTDGETLTVMGAALARLAEAQR